MELPPQQLINWAVRLTAYSGVVAARISSEERGVDSDGSGVRTVDPTAGAIAADPIFNNIIDIG